MLLLKHVIGLRALKQLSLHFFPTNPPPQMPRAQWYHFPKWSFLAEELDSPFILCPRYKEMGLPITLL